MLRSVHRLVVNIDCLLCGGGKVAFKFARAQNSCLVSLETRFTRAVRVNPISKYMSLLSENYLWIFLYKWLNIFPCQLQMQKPLITIDLLYLVPHANFFHSPLFFINHSGNPAIFYINTLASNVGVSWLKNLIKKTCKILLNEIKNQ